MSLMLDLAVLAVLALFAWRGARKGLILTLCGLLAVAVAFFGSFWISDRLCEPVGEFIQPYVTSYMEKLVDRSLGQSTDSNPDTEDTIFPQITPDTSEEEQTESAALSLDELLTQLQDSKLLYGILQPAAEAVKAEAFAAATSVIAALATQLSVQLARVLLFLVSFVLLLLVWWLLSHMLDLAFRLPVLHTFNRAGGLLLGLVKGVLLLWVVCFAIRVFELIPSDVTEQTLLFSLFLNFQVI